MAITNINVYQDNSYGSSNLIATHNPIIFLADADYSGETPDYIYCDVKNSDDELLGKFKLIPYVDVISTRRRFMFIADEILRGFMEKFDDFYQSTGSIEYCEGFTKVFKLKFYYDVVYDEIEITAIHSARQFGETCNAFEIYENHSKTYIGIDGMPMDFYIFSDSESNIISSQEGELSNILLDYDGEEFADFDDELFEGITT